jgi:hypothetical protein
MKDTRAIAIAVAVLAVVVVFWAYVRHPAPGMRRVRAFRVEIHGQEDGHRRDVSVRIPGFLVGKAVHMASRAWDERRREGRGFQFNGVTITPREILEAADKSASGHPGSIEVGDGKGTLQVSKEGSAIRIGFHRDNEEHGEILVPRALLERLAQDEPISPRELLERIDEMGPGDLVLIKGENGEVRISAEGR